MIIELHFKIFLLESFEFMWIIARERKTDPLNLLPLS